MRTSLSLLADFRLCSSSVFLLINHLLHPSTTLYSTQNRLASRESHIDILVFRAACPIAPRCTPPRAIVYRGLLLTLRQHLGPCAREGQLAANNLGALFLPGLSRSQSQHRHTRLLAACLTSFSALLQRLFATTALAKSSQRLDKHSQR